MGRGRGQETDFDVVIVGARVAGSILATYLGRAGVRVLVIDRGNFPSPACSTHFFRGAGLVDVLDDIGVLPEALATGAPPLVRQWTTVGAGGVAVESGPQAPGVIGHALSVRRETLDHLLVETARATAGVEFRLATRAVDAVTEDGRVTAVVVEHGGHATRVGARLVVGADGKGSWLARTVGARDELTERGHRALFYKYVTGWAAPDGGQVLDAAEFSIVGDEIAYVFPSDAGQTCVAVSVSLPTFAGMKPDLELGWRARLGSHRAFAARLDACTPVSKVLGAGPSVNRIRAAAGPGWALVGDAGQYQDPWTGQGMDFAGLGARALVDDVVRRLDGQLDHEGFAASWTAHRDEIGRAGWMQTVMGSRDLTPAA